MRDDEAMAGCGMWRPDFPHHLLQVVAEGRRIHLDAKALDCRICENRRQARRNSDCGRPSGPAV